VVRFVFQFRHDDMNTEGKTERKTEEGQNEDEEQKGRRTRDMNKNLEEKERLGSREQDKKASLSLCVFVLVQSYWHM